MQPSGAARVRFQRRLRIREPRFEVGTPLRKKCKKIHFFSSGLMGPVWSPGNVIFSITHIIARLRKKPENKKCKILDKRSFNVESHRMSPTRPENNAASFIFWIRSRSSRRNPGKITVLGRCLCTLKHRLSRILHFLFSGFFL